MPASYAQREQAYIKHKLLESYLQKLFLIVGSGSKREALEICYVDCFAGPWGDDSEGMETTSIAISLRTLDGCRQELAKQGLRITMRAMFIEKDRKAFGRLKTYLDQSAPAEVQVSCLCGDFVALRQDILTWTGDKAFAFFFVDPMGYTEASVEIVAPLLGRPRSEILINFMYNFLNRTMSNPAFEADMKKLVGQRLDLAGLNSEEREGLILDTYRENLKRCVPKQGGKYVPRSAYVRVMHPTDDRPWYHLVYITSHPKGIIEFMTVSETVDVVQKQVRSSTKGAKREAESGVTDMFPGSEMENFKAGKAGEDDVDRFWLDYLCNGTHRIDQALFADILEQTDWFPTDLQASLKRLMTQGRIRNLDANGNRPKRPLHFEKAGGERLSLLGTAQSCIV